MVMDVIPVLCILSRFQIDTFHPAVGGADAVPDPQFLLLSARIKTIKGARSVPLVIQIPCTAICLPLRTLLRYLHFLEHLPTWTNYRITWPR